MISSNIIRGYTHLRMFCWNESHGKRRTYYHITDNRRSCCLEKCEQRSLTQKIINSFISVRDSLGVIFLLFTVACAVFLFVPPLYQNGFDILLRLKEYASERKKRTSSFPLMPPYGGGLSPSYSSSGASNTVDGTSVGLSGPSAVCCL